jgi:tetratricopeptide (TPR) repeat protein
MNLKSDHLAYAVIGVIAFCVFANTLGHGFVYDDNRQILMNPLIQRSESYVKALTSDVWAFKGGEGLAASNYFRPTFVSWMIANWYLFGASPFGWHLLSVLQHVLVCLLLFALLRQFDCERFTATVIAVLFAVHPAHVESVAWISGATDTLLGIFLFASLILAGLYSRETTSRPRRTTYLVLSLAAFLLAAGSKEVALFCLPLYWLIFRHAGPDESFVTPTVRTLPFAAVAVGFFALRVWVLGAVFLPVEDPIAKGSVLISVPKLFVFYLQQMFLPLWLGPALPIRPVEAFDLMGVVVPAVISVLVIASLALLARRSFIQWLGVALFALTIAPVLNLSNFGIEHTAHDRYLYLPIAGMLMVIIPAVIRLAGEVTEAPKLKLITAAMAVVALLLAIKTVSYNSHWSSSETLWRYAVTIDPNSAHAWYNLASATANPRESLNAYEQSMRLRPNPTASAGKARALIGLGNYEGAVVAAREAIAVDPRFVTAYTLFQAYEAETYALAGLGRYNEAEASLRSARERLPIYFAALSVKLAVVLYSQNRKQEALNELESARDEARTEDLADSKSVLLRLGMLYAEAGNRDAARNTLREYLALTEGLATVPAADRKQAADLLAKL